MSDEKKFARLRAIVAGRTPTVVSRCLLPGGTAESFERYGYGADFYLVIPSVCVPSPGVLESPDTVRIVPEGSPDWRRFRSA
jgi:hypothetical protein